MLSHARLALPVAAAALAISACGAATAATTNSSGGGYGAAATHATHATHATYAANGYAGATAAKASAAVLKLAKVAVADGGSTVHQKILVDASGHSVYLLTGDSTKHPQCTSSGCLSTWPAVTTTAKHPKLGSGVSGKLTVWRHAGISQLVLNGHPLYTFAGDSSAGIANGNGISSFGGTWWVLNAKGQEAKLTSSGTSGGGGGGGGW